MKLLNKYTAIICLFAAALASCESPDLAEGRTDQVKGLLNVTIKIPDNPAEFTATKKGPYEEGEEITVKVPTTDEDPLDLTRLICTVSLEHNCYVETPLTGETDFTEPLKITVIDVQGNRHNNTIKILPTPPKTKFAKLWDKNSVELNINDRNLTGLAMTEKGLAVQVYDGNIFRYDRKTGSGLDIVPSARSFMMKADVDDAGHLITARENVYGAGFMVYYYSEEDKEHHLLLDYTDGDGCPEDMGYEMSVIGDVTKGKSFIYGIAPSMMNIYYWELMDGELVTPANEPIILRYGPAGANWDRAQVQRASLDGNSDHYISFYTPSSDDADDEYRKEKKGSRFNIFSPYMDINELNPQNHSYKILDFKVFTVNEDVFLATIEQNYSAWGNAKVQVFEITNRNKMELTAEDAGYDELCLFTGEEIAPTNYNRWGDISIYKEQTATGYDVYIASTVVGYDATESRIRMYKMSYYPQ